MGKVQVLTTGEVRCLPLSIEAGREAECGLSFLRDEVSRRHALISWHESHWQVRDLASTNGTFLDGVRIPPGADVPLRAGQTLGLGRLRPPLLEVTSDEPPRPFARNLETGEEREEGDDGAIALPEGTVRLDLEAGWVLEGPEAPRVVRRIVGRWSLSVPEAERPTVRSECSLAEAVLCFTASADLNAIRLELRWPTQTIDLGRRQPFWPLMLLARVRREGGDGWLPVERLAHMAGLERRTLDVYLGRARRALALANVHDGDQVVDIRQGQRRIAVPAERLEERRGE